MATEDYTSYTIVDPNNHFTVSSAQVLQQSWDDEIAYVYKDYDDAHFGDFTHDFAVRVTSTFSNTSTAFWMLANAIGDRKALNDAGETRIGFFSFHSDGRFLLNETYSGTSTSSNTFVPALNTWYYITIKKSGISLTAEIYNDVGELIDTLSLTLSADHTFRFLYAACSYNINTARYSEGIVANLDLNEITARNWILPTVIIATAIIGGISYYLIKKKF